MKLEELRASSGSTRTGTPTGPDASRSMLQSRSLLPTTMSRSSTLSLTSMRRLRSHPSSNHLSIATLERRPPPSPFSAAPLSSLVCNPLPPDMLASHHHIDFYVRIPAHLTCDLFWKPGHPTWQEADLVDSDGRVCGSRFPSSRHPYRPRVQCTTPCKRYRLSW